jgi:uncharacterized protein
VISDLGAAIDARPVRRGNRTKFILRRALISTVRRVNYFCNLLMPLVAVALCSGCDRKTLAPPAAEKNVQWAPNEAQPRLPTTKLWIGAAEITAEIASQPREIRTGMMFRTNAPDTEGMLFVFRQPRQAAFWMKNCPLPLSCAYIDPQGVILELHDMEPHNTNAIVAATDNVMFVLEVNRGWFERHQVRTNMVIQTERGPLLQTLFDNNSTR